jgi:hypothetical protein
MDSPLQLGTITTLPLMEALGPIRNHIDVLPQGHPITILGDTIVDLQSTDSLPSALETVEAIHSRATESTRNATIGRVASRYVREALATESADVEVNPSAYGELIRRAGSEAESLVSPQVSKTAIDEKAVRLVSAQQEIVHDVAEQIAQLRLTRYLVKKPLVRRFGEKIGVSSVLVPDINLTPQKIIPRETLLSLQVLTATMRKIKTGFPPETVAAIESELVEHMVGTSIEVLKPSLDNIVQKYLALMKRRPEPYASEVAGSTNTRSDRISTYAERIVPRDSDSNNRIVDSPGIVIALPDNPEGDLVIDLTGAETENSTDEIVYEGVSKAPWNEGEPITIFERTLKGKKILFANVMSPYNHKLYVEDLQKDSKVSSIIEAERDKVLRGFADNILIGKLGFRREEITNEYSGHWPIYQKKSLALNAPGIYYLVARVNDLIDQNPKKMTPAETNQEVVCIIAAMTKAVQKSVIVKMQKSALPASRLS